MRPGEKHHRIGLHKVRKKRHDLLRTTSSMILQQFFWIGRFIAIPKVHLIPISNDSMVGGLLWVIGLTMKHQPTIGWATTKNILWRNNAKETLVSGSKKLQNSKRGKTRRFLPQTYFVGKVDPNFCCRCLKEPVDTRVAPGWNRGKYQV